MDLFAEITPNTLLLTANARSSADLLKKYNAEQVKQGKLSWPTLPILEISKWLQQTWHQETTHQISILPRLLTPNQEQILWEEILRASPESDYLLQLSSTAELARAAWSTLKQWCVELDNPALTTTDDGYIFHTWAQQFETQCKKNNWIDTHSVVNIIIQKITTRQITPPKKIILIGFAELSPQYKNFLDACENTGSQIIHYESTKIESHVNRIGLNDTETEIRTMARWAKAIYEKTDKARICCVIPNLEDARERVIQLFSDVFTENNTYTLDYTKLPFNISAGRSLAGYPVIHAALQILSIKNKTISMETLSSILRSPFIGAAEYEQFSRAKLDSALRKENMTDIDFHKLLEKKSIQNCPALIKHIQHYLNQLPDKSQKRLISEWVTIFVDNLTAWGWPGERTLDSPEYQTVTAWFKLLNEYAAYDSLLPPLSYKQALHYLTYLTGKAVFQPESPEARIQILGPLEAAALTFDYMWVMGLDDTAWPQSPKPNPFIPQRLQRTLQMPRATAERELTYAKYITEQFKSNAKEIIFSYPLKNDDAELRPSPIITDIPAIDMDDLELANFISPEQTIFTSKKLTLLQDEIAPAISENEQIRGGSSIFKNQALCPFKAFAELRLHAGKIDPPTIGLRPKDRGDIVHVAMEKLWLALKDHDALINMMPEDLHHLIKQAINQAMNEIITDTKNQRYLDLESQRLQKLFIDWFELEKARPYFKIKALEEERQTTFGKIPLTVRADRIDTLENGKHIIIDYKTGKNSPSRDWFDERPNEPQLPLYCVLDAENTAGILFAQVNPEEMKWKGVSEISLEIDSVKTLHEEKSTEATDWKQQVEQWKQTLEKLGDDFYHGKAHVDPKDPVETCRHCHLQTLCRVNETI